MRKQTKLVAVLSAAALLAIGASMTSFAKGWTEENGEWVYLDRYGDRVTTEWKKSGENYYYLDEEGVMATSTLIEYKDDIYYVNESGVKVMNQWVSVENEDEVDVDGKEVDVLWYFFGSAGKATKASSGKELSVKTVPYAAGDGKFVFDADGHMVSGWTSVDGDLYYLGDENQGWARTGWQLLEPSEYMNNDDYDDEEYFYFQSSGKAHKAAEGKTVTKYISGKYYSFDENGVMVDGWFTVATPPTPAAGASAADAFATSDGVMKSGWVWTTADGDDDGDEHWYYLVSIRDGKNVARSVAFNTNMNDKLMRAKVIKSKTYLFNSDGTMKTGVVKIEDGDVPTQKNTFYGVEDRVLTPGIYYFTKGGYTATAGQMVTGKAAVTEDGETYYYHFNKTTGKAYTNSVKDGILYGEDGKRIAADDGNANMVYTINANEEIKVLNSKDEVTAKLSNCDIIVSSSGKVRTSGTVKIDNVRYTVKDYVIVEEKTID